MLKVLRLHQRRLSSSVIFGSNTSYYIRADYHGPVHRRNGLQIQRFLKRFAGELEFVSPNKYNSYIEVIFFKKY